MRRRKHLFANILPFRWHVERFFVAIFIFLFFSKVAFLHLSERERDRERERERERDRDRERGGIWRVREIGREFGRVS